MVREMRTMCGTILTAAACLSADVLAGERSVLRLGAPFADHAASFLADGTVSGLIFHPTYAAALDAPAVNLAKKWIRAHGDDRWSC